MIPDLNLNVNSNINEKTSNLQQKLEPIELSVSSNSSSNNKAQSLSSSSSSPPPPYCKHVNTGNIPRLKSMVDVLTTNVINEINSNENCTKLKDDLIFCQHCKNREINDLYACLDCTYIGCNSKSHLKQHSIDKDHFLSINLTNSNLTCQKCIDDVTCTQTTNYCDKTDQDTNLLNNCDGFTYELLNELQNSFFEKCVMDVFNSPPVGIINVGNSCFVNCVIQILLATPPLKKFFLSGTHCCNYSDSSISCITCELALIFQYTFTASNDVKLNVENLIRALLHKNHRHITIAQQDAHEYLRMIIEKIQFEMSQVQQSTRHKNSNLCNCGDNCSHINLQSIKPSINLTSYFDDIFQGTYTFKILCVNCKNVTTKLEPFIDLSLGLPLDDTISTTTSNSSSNKKDKPIQLYDCLERFVQEEKLSVGHSSYCNHCDARQQKVTKITLCKLPSILCLHLKKFTITNGIQKLHVNVEFPDKLDLKNFINSKSENFYNDDNDIKAQNDIKINGGTTYRLYGVIVHKGSYDFGHYISYVKIQDSWYLCDDETIQPTTYEIVTKSESYILFYIRDHNE